MLKQDILKKEQLKLAKEVILRDEFSKVSYIGGCDQALINNEIVSAVVVLDKKLELIEFKYAKVKTGIPYIPGYLFYREGPAIVEAFNQLEKKPDILMIDDNGILHPRKIGMATQLGIILDLPTIGVAKKLVFGKVEKGKIYVGNEIRGIELRTKEHSNPIFVSPGHKITLGKSMEIVKECIKFPHKLPEPLYTAHRIVNDIAKSISS